MGVSGVSPGGGFEHLQGPMVPINQLKDLTQQMKGLSGGNPSLDQAAGNLLGAISDYQQQGSDANLQKLKDAGQGLLKQLPTQLQPGEQALGAGEQALGAGEQPLRAGEQPLKSGEQPLRAGEQPLKSGEQPLRAGEQPLKSGEQPLRAGEQPLKSGEQPLTPLEKPFQPIVGPGEGQQALSPAMEKLLEPLTQMLQTLGPAEG